MQSLLWNDKTIVPLLQPCNSFAIMEHEASVSLVGPIPASKLWKVSKDVKSYGQSEHLNFCICCTIMSENPHWHNHDFHTMYSFFVYVSVTRGFGHDHATYTKKMFILSIAFRNFYTFHGFAAKCWTLTYQGNGSFLFHIGNKITCRSKRIVVLSFQRTDCRTKLSCPQYDGSTS